MTGDELRQARARLGHLWALDRPVHCAELGRALEMFDEDPGAAIRRHEADRIGEVPRAIAAGVKMMLNGSLPPDGLSKVLLPAKRRRRRRSRR